jgi:hypothetical protein
LQKAEENRYEECPLCSHSRFPPAFFKILKKMIEWPEIDRIESEAVPLEPVDPPNAGLVLILGLLGILLCCGFPGVFAFVIGTLEREKVQQRIYRPSGILTAGWVLGIIGTIISVLLLCVLYAVFILTVFFGATAASPQ